MGALYGAQIGYGIGASRLSTTLPGQEGPRLSDLQTQTSEYGAPLGNVYGTNKRAGVVIWSGTIEETKTTQQQEQGGKGAPSTKTSYSTYSYSASFAVAFNDGPITGVRRIWLNDRLAFDESDYSEYSFSSASEEAAWIVSRRFTAEDGGSITIYSGSTTQEPDPTIESYEGAGNVPGFRDTAYLVFTDLQLERFGNRRPLVFVEYVVKNSGFSTSDNTILSVDLSSFFDYTSKNQISNVYADGTCGFFASKNSTEMKCYYVFPSGAVPYIGRFIVPTNDMRGVHSQYPMFCDGNSKVYEPFGGLGEDRAISYQLDITGLTIVAGNLDTYLCHVGTIQRGKIALLPNNTVVRLFNYWKNVSYSLFFGPSTNVQYFYNDFTIANPSARNSWALTDNYFWQVFKNGELFKYDHSGELIGHWNTGFLESASFPSNDVMHVVDERFVYWTYYGQNRLYRYDIVTEELTFWASILTSGVGDAGNISISNGIFTEYKRDGQLKYKALDMVSQTAESLDYIVTDLCEQSGLSASDIDVTSLAGITVDGFIFMGGDAGKAIESLMMAYQFSCYEDENKLNFRMRSGATDKTVSPSDLDTVLV